MALTKDDVEKLKQNHGDELIALDKPMDMVFKKPSREIWADFQDAVAKDKGSREGAYRRLSIACCVHPSQDDAVTVFDKYPGLPTKIGDALGKLVGLGEEFDVKKL